MRRLFLGTIVAAACTGCVAPMIRSTRHAPDPMTTFVWVSTKVVRDIGTALGETGRLDPTRGDPGLFEKVQSSTT